MIRLLFNATLWWSIFVSGLLVVISVPAVLTFSVAPYPAGVLLLLPWYGGVCGTLGLLALLVKPDSKSPMRLRIEVLLLALGIVSAVLLSAVLFAFLFTFATQTPGPWLLPEIMATSVAFPLLPMLVALVGSLQLAARWRQQPLQDRVQWRRALGMLFGIPLLLIAARVLSQEGAMLWYGHDLSERARVAAEQAAAGQAWCVIDFQGAGTLAALDERRILLQAFQNNLGQRSLVVNPHFGIKINDEVLWWSFRQGRFLPLYNFTTGNCTLPGGPASG